MALKSVRKTLQQQIAAPTGDEIMSNKQEKSSGFTLIELMVTISIAGILLGIAIPSFTETITSSRLTTNANELMTALNFARSEAVKRGVQVTVINRGASTQWESGWDVFVDINGDGVLDDASPLTPCQTNANGSLSEDCLLRTYNALPGGYTLRSGSTYACWVGYTSSGLSVGSGSACTGGFPNDSFKLCDSAGTTATARVIAVNNTGRARVTVAGISSCT